MRPSDLMDFLREVSEKSKFAENMPKMDSIRVAKFCRGSTKLFWKENFEEEEFKSAEFLQKQLINSVNSVSGITTPPPPLLYQCWSSRYVCFQAGRHCQKGVPLNAIYA